MYTFVKNDSGKLEYLHVLSWAGDGVLITKSSVMRGACSFINFGALPVAESSTLRPMPHLQNSRPERASLLSLFPGPRENLGASCMESTRPH